MNLTRILKKYVQEDNCNKNAKIVCHSLQQAGPYLKNMEPGRILYAMHMPPPVHGASMMGQYIRDSKLLQNSFDGKYINLTAAADLNDIGHFGLKKAINYLKMLRDLRKSIKTFKPHVIYITPTAAGIGFYKDFITVSLIKFWSGYSFFDCKWPVKIIWNSKTKKKIADKLRKPIILVHYHNKGVKDFSESAFNNWLYINFFKDLYVLLLGETLYDDVKKYVSVGRVRFCGNGLPVLPDIEDKEITENLRAKCERRANTPLNILYLSNMMEEKGVWTLVDACKILKDRGVNFKCIFVGGWKDITEDKFKQTVVELDLQAEISAVGPKYGDEKKSYWQQADVFVFPTFYHNECFPLVLLEAMQHALPCISTKEGAISNIIDDGETGYIVNAKNQEHLAAKIAELAKDSQKRLEMSVRGYQKFQKEFTIYVFEKRLNDILEQLI